MDELIKRLEAASGADRDLDGRIMKAVGGPIWEAACQRASMPCGAQPDVIDRDARLYAPAYTASVDAALTLLGKNCGWTVGLKLDGRFFAVVYIDDGARTSEAHTAANALSAAALRARQP